MHLDLAAVALVVLGATLLPGAVAWGTLGHRTVAYLASLHFTPASQRLANTLLHGQDISEAALFADKVRYMPGFAYSSAWHYIEAHDRPPHACGIDMARDCAAGDCVVSAIANHSARVADASLPGWARGQSLRFLLHFVGDVHQPLHTEAEARGGNGVEVLWDGHRTNLHSVWDALIPDKMAGGHARGATEEENAMLWAMRLFDRGATAADAEGFAAAAAAADDDKSCGDDAAAAAAADDDKSCGDDAAACALSWASEANLWVCRYVLKEDVRGRELAAGYYEGAVPIIDDMVAKAGRRLGLWINMISAALEGGNNEGALHTQ